MTEQKAEQKIIGTLRQDAVERAKATSHRDKTPACFSLLEYERGVTYGWTADQWKHLRTGCAYCTRTIEMARRVVNEEAAPRPLRPLGQRFVEDPQAAILPALAAKVREWIADLLPLTPAPVGTFESGFAPLAGQFDSLPEGVFVAMRRQKEGILFDAWTERMELDGLGLEALLLAEDGELTRGQTTFRPKYGNLLVAEITLVSERATQAKVRLAVGHGLPL